MNCWVSARWQEFQPITLWSFISMALLSTSDCIAEFYPDGIAIAEFQRLHCWVLSWWHCWVFDRWHCWGSSWWHCWVSSPMALPSFISMALLSLSNSIAEFYPNDVSARWHEFQPTALMRFIPMALLSFSPGAWVSAVVLRSFSLMALLSIRSEDSQIQCKKTRDLAIYHSSKPGDIIDQYPKFQNCIMLKYSGRSRA